MGAVIPSHPPSLQQHPISVICLVGIFEGMAYLHLAISLSLSPSLLVWAPSLSLSFPLSIYLSIYLSFVHVCNFVYVQHL